MRARQYESVEALGPPYHGAVKRGRPRPLCHAAAALFAAAFAACTLGWEQVDRCGEHGCTRCRSDGDCVSGSSCCGKTLFCSHRDDSPIVCQLGCDVPDADPCLCVDGRCRFRDD